MSSALDQNTNYVFGLLLGCPRNKQKKFRFEPKQTETQSVSVDFRFVWRKQKQFFRFVSVFGPVSKQPKQTHLFRNKPKKTTTKKQKKKGILNCRVGEPDP
jgi:hypothetical protein